MSVMRFGPFGDPFRSLDRLAGKPAPGQLRSLLIRART